MALSFSIVIPTLDRWPMLSEALASVRAQQWPKAEIIVVDGGSTDGTVEALRRDPDVLLVEGPDGGIYDAFNKGIACASADVVGILNSDDHYPAGTFAAVASAFSADAQAVCGTAVLASHEQVIAVFDAEEDKALASPRTALIGSCCLNARFIRRAAIARVGPFRLDYRFVSDRDWLTRWYEAKLPTVTIPEVAYHYRQHPNSLTFDADRRCELAIREELLSLARRWRQDSHASAETRRAAALLEGRCIATLALADLRNRHLAEFARRLFADARGPSIAPALSLILGGADWAAEAIRRSRLSVAKRR